MCFLSACGDRADKLGTVMTAAELRAYHRPLIHLELSHIGTGHFPGSQ